MTKQEFREIIKEKAEVHAIHHSSAPDKCTPDWIITDYTAGADAAWDILKPEIYAAWQRGKEDGFDLGKLTDPLGSKDN